MIPGRPEQRSASGEAANPAAATLESSAVASARALDFPPGLGRSVADDAERYVRAGWFVLPVAAGTGDPASLLGPDWAKRSTRKVSKIRKWFRKWPDADLALDLARSGAVAFRILEGAPSPPSVQLLTVMAAGSFLRGARSGLGAYVFALGERVALQSGHYGPLRGEAEVLCLDAVLTVPSPGRPGREGGYRWHPGGSVPVLPADLQDGLVAASEDQGRAVGRGLAGDDVARGSTGLSATAPEPVRSGALVPLRPRSSWAPKDLSGPLEGGLEPLEASLMIRTDGVGLLYPGMVHSFFGEPESGKSLLLQWTCVDVLWEGRDVLYVDFESDEDSILRRLIALGAKPKHIQKNFTYVRPETDLSTEEDTMVWEELLTRSFALAVIDGVTESLDLFGYKSTDNDNVARWMRTIPRLLAARTGAAVVLIDHVTKSREGRGRFPVGAQAKLAAITGAAYMVEPLGRLVGGGRGEFELRLVKDRPGSVGRHAARGTSRTPLIARAVITSRGGPGHREGLDVELEPPGSVDADATSSGGDEDLDQKILRVVEDHPGLTQTKLLARLGGNRPVMTARLNQLEQEGRLRVEPGMRKAKQYYPAS